VWIHGRQQGSMNTSVQMEHSILSSSLSDDDCRAILGYISCCLYSGSPIVNYMTLGISSEMKAELKSLLLEAMFIYVSSLALLDHS